MKKIITSLLIASILLPQLAFAISVRTPSVRVSTPSVRISTPRVSIPVRVPSVRVSPPPAVSSPVRVPSVRVVPPTSSTKANPSAIVQNLRGSQTTGIPTIHSYSYNPFSSNFLLWYLLFAKPSVNKNQKVDCSKEENKIKNECKNEGNRTNN